MVHAVFLRFLLGTATAQHLVQSTGEFGTEKKRIELRVRIRSREPQHRLCRAEFHLTLAVSKSVDPMMIKRPGQSVQALNFCCLDSKCAGIRYGSANLNQQPILPIVGNKVRYGEILHDVNVEVRNVVARTREPPMNDGLVHQPIDLVFPQHRKPSRARNEPGRQIGYVAIVAMVHDLRPYAGPRKLPSSFEDHAKQLTPTIMIVGHRSGTNENDQRRQALSDVDSNDPGQGQGDVRLV
jgi:hypothetical protein